MTNNVSKLCAEKFAKYELWPTIWDDHASDEHIDVVSTLDFIYFAITHDQFAKRC